jgi:hypothetical protein
MNTRQSVSIIPSAPDVRGDDHLDSISEVDAEVLRAIRNIRYGSVEITIHDSRVVQIERKEKRRFEASRRPA